MEFVEVNKQLHLLLQLPEYIAMKRTELEDVYDEIKFPVMSVNEIGRLSINCPSTEKQAIYLATKTTRIENEIKQAINDGKRLVNAINSLDADDKKTLFDYYIKNNPTNEKPKFKKIWNYFTKERNERIALLDDEKELKEVEQCIKETTTNNVNRIAELLGVS